MKDHCECGGKAKVVRKDYLFRESGLNNILLRDIEVEVCSRCQSESPLIPNHNDLMRTIAVALIDKPSQLTGEEVRFLRAYLGEESRLLAKALGITDSHLCRVEHGTMPVSRQTDRLIRTLALLYAPGLLDKLKRLGRRGTLVRRLGTIEHRARAENAKDDASLVEFQLAHAEKGYTYSRDAQ